MDEVVDLDRLPQTKPRVRQTITGGVSLAHLSTSTASEFRVMVFELFGLPEQPVFLGFIWLSRACGTKSDPQLSCTLPKCATLRFNLVASAKVEKGKQWPNNRQTIANGPILSRLKAQSLLANKRPIYTRIPWPSSPTLRVTSRKIEAEALSLKVKRLQEP
ncbi:hypothetical protein RF11_03643 [Thelohanellus kitauei]|uniref:Uncharacterized protein n=1 Tax=Thelohanellus kitauei TaxID=669202 RepID=A0A0C2MTQ1_THEKT|nr:hypothetical protein RF11_03643 [Thelohanellus kitauei]